MGLGASARRLVGEATWEFRAVSENCHDLACHYWLCSLHQVMLFLRASISSAVTWVDHTAQPGRSLPDLQVHHVVKFSLRDFKKNYYVKIYIA